MLKHIIENLHLAKNDNAKSYMSQYFTLRGKIQCTTCEGYGHTSRTCYTKKRIDQATRKSELSIPWGRMKSDLKMNFMDERAKIAKKLRDGKFAAHIKRELPSRSVSSVQLDSEKIQQTPQATDNMNME